jgi:hypothetical protein
MFRSRFKYYMAIGVFALDRLALERPFCLDTCVLEHSMSETGE